MTYAQTVDWLLNQLPVFQLQGQTAYKPGLERITALCEALGNPQDKFKIIHVAGTNGKGSICHYLTSILMESGYKTGLHTSPHLKDFRERMTINGQLPPEEFVVDFVRDIQPIIAQIKPTFFELTVAMTFTHFANESVDFAVIETGMGGRLDSTNIVNPELSIISKIGWDHQDYLGNTLEKIASEKGGIIKEGKPVVISHNLPEVTQTLRTIAQERNAPFIQSDLSNLKGFNLAHLPAFQHENLSSVVAAAGLLREHGVRIKIEAIESGIRQVTPNTGFKGRWYKIDTTPAIVFDTGHNADAIDQLAANLSIETYSNLHIVWGMVSDKDHQAILSALPKEAAYYFCAPNNFRALDPKTLKDMASHKGLNGHTFESAEKALQAAKQAAKPKDLILVGGSTFLVAELL